MLVPLLGQSGFTNAQINETGSKAAYSTPEAEGISSRDILNFVEALEVAQPDAIHSVMLRRHGHLFVLSYPPEAYRQYHTEVSHPSV